MEFTLSTNASSSTIYIISNMFWVLTCWMSHSSSSLWLPTKPSSDLAQELHGCGVGQNHEGWVCLVGSQCRFHEQPKGPNGCHFLGYPFTYITSGQVEQILASHNHILHLKINSHTSTHSFTLTQSIKCRHKVPTFSFPFCFFFGSKKSHTLKEKY